MAKRKPILTSKKTRYVRPTVIILGDGETEESYINRLKELDFFENVHLKYEKGNELNFETKIKEHATNKNVIVIIDVDNAASNSPKYNEIKRLVETKKYQGRVFFNNYAFELWLLNHIDYFSTPITDKSQYDSSINDIFGVESWSRYKNQRNRKKIMDMINKDTVEEAVTNINRLNKKKPFDNPSSNMDDCIKKIKKIK
ncbi:MAG: RloB domain-containing protein [Sphaerochaeta sp.]